MKNSNHQFQNLVNADQKIVKNVMRLTIFGENFTLRKTEIQSFLGGNNQGFWNGTSNAIINGINLKNIV